MAGLGLRVEFEGLIVWSGSGPRHAHCAVEPYSVAYPTANRYRNGGGMG